MKAITVASPGSALIVSELPVPEPADDQILVKVIYTAINPVDGMAVNMGLLVEEWPFTPGCDVGGIVIKAGANAISARGTPFRPGDRVSGCSGVGRDKFGTFQEQALMVAKVTLPVPDTMSFADAATLGVGSYTAGVAVFVYLNVAVPEPEKLPPTKDEWALVLGGASSVGKMAAQILKICGYKVIVTVSPQSADMLKTLGIDAVVDYKQSEADIIAEIVKKTGGKMYRVFDAVAQNMAFAAPMFKAIEGDEKWFTSTNDWEPLAKTDEFHFTPVSLGPVGRPGATALNDQIAAFIPFLASMLEQGKLMPAEYVQIGGTGVESVPGALEYQTSGKGGNKKVVVKIQDE